MHSRTPQTICDHHSLLYALPILTSLLSVSSSSVFAQNDASKQASRTLRTDFTCSASIPSYPAGTKKLAIWVPLPSNSDWQQVESVNIEGVEGYKITEEPRYHNRMVFVQIDAPHEAVVMKVRFRVNRKEMKVLDAETPQKFAKPSSAFLHANLEAEKSLPIGGRFSTISNEAIDGKKSNIEKARALYDHTVKTMTYDYKNESPKLGQGDAEFVCDLKKGDCTDIHSYLISLARTQGIPIIHEYGFGVTGVPVANPLPKTAKITSYHCYTRFYDPKFGWVPMDPSDGIRWNDKNQTRLKDFHFGNILLERNAVVMSQGRNLVLSPAQQGEPVNKFIYPYAEADGAPVNVKLDLSRTLIDSVPEATFAEAVTVAPSPVVANPSAQPPTPGTNEDLQRQIDELKKLVLDQAKQIAEMKPAKAVVAAPKEAPPVSPTLTTKEKISIYGHIRLDSMWDSSLTNNTQSPLYVLSPNNPNKGSNANGALAIHPRLSRLGFNFNAPPETSSGWRVGGKLEIDWQNGAGLTAESRPIPRIRHAYMTLARGASTILLGQYWDLIAPGNPTVNDDTMMWNAGNLGDRRVQMRYTYEPKASRFNIAAALGLTGAVDQQDLDANGVRDGEDSSLPNIQARAQFKNSKTTFGIWGHHAWERTTKAVANRHRFIGYSLGFDALQQITSKLTASGEFWVGQNLSDFRGGIAQGVNAVTGAEVRSHGGWMELGYQVSPKYKFAMGYSEDSPEKNDISVGGRLSNNALYLHNRYKLTNNVDLGASYYYWTTRYNGQASGIDHRFQMFVQHNF